MALLQRLSFIMLLITLVGCGSGEGGLDGGGSGPIDADAITITLSISDVNVTEQNPATITATVLQGTAVMSGKSFVFGCVVPSLHSDCMFSEVLLCV